MSKILFSVDPGTRFASLATFVDSELVGVLGMDVQSGTLAMRIRDMRAHPYLSAFPATAEDDQRVVIELPRVYPGDVKGDPNDLIDLAAVGGAFIPLGINGATFFYPRQWKGQMPKDVCQRRIEKVLQPIELSACERTMRRYRKGMHHNLWDAIGIGLHALGRFGVEGRAA